MNDDLKAVLRTLLDSGTRSNPALNALLDDYARHHAVLVVAGGLAVMVFAALGVVFWTRWRRAAGAAGRFERWTYAGFGALSILAGLSIAVIVAANATNAWDPRNGLSLAVDSLGAAAPARRPPRCTRRSRPGCARAARRRRPSSRPGFTSGSCPTPRRPSSQGSC